MTPLSLSENLPLASDNGFLISNQTDDLFQAFQQNFVSLSNAQIQQVQVLIPQDYEIRLQRVIF